MNPREQQAVTTLVERYEAKFTIPDHMIEPISEFASRYCDLDLYSAKAGDGYYRVNSLYLDTPNYLFLRKRLEGSENRFNMRIRSYGDQPSAPYYLEIKQKKVNLVRKFRAEINHESWDEMFGPSGYGSPTHGADGAQGQNLELFLKTAYAHNATPKVLTQYKRKAYVSDVDDYGRITFDRDLRCRCESGYTIVPDKEKMTPLDDETLFDPGANLILELKCIPTRVPLWMVDLIRHFDLRRRSFSKYVTGVSQVLGQFKYDPAARQPVSFPALS